MMKKIFALLVVLSMALCFVACGTPEEQPTPETSACTEHVDNDGDGICDTAGCGATVQKPGTPEDDEATKIMNLAKALVGEGAALSKVNVTGEYVKDVFVDANGKGYVVRVLVMSQYGTPETETLVYINAEGKLAGVNKLVFKTSDPMYGYVPPTEEVVDAFYAKLTGKNFAEFKAAFTGEGVELVTNATSTSTKLVASIVEAFEVVDAVNNGAASVPMDPTAATTYVNAIWGAVENAKTVTATIYVYQSQSNSDAVNAEGEVVYEADEFWAYARMDVTLAMSENGLNVKIVGDGVNDGGTSKIEGYIVDGVEYSRISENDVWGEWEVQPFEMPEDAAGILTQLEAIITEAIPDDFEMTAEKISEIKATLGTAIATAMGVNPDGSFGLRVDSKVAIDAMLDYFKGIKAEDTVGSVINGILAMIDPEMMTIEAILDEIGTNGAVTVGEVYTALNAALVEETGKSINDIKNALLAQEAIVTILVEEGIADAETLAAIAGNDVEVMIADYTEMTLDDLVYMIMAAQSAPEESPNPGESPAPEASAANDEPVEEPVDTTGMLAALMGQFKEMLAMTVGDALEGEYDAVMGIINSIDLRANYVYFTAKIGDDLAIEKIEIAQKVDFSATVVTTYYQSVEVETGVFESTPVEITVTNSQTQEIVCTITSVSNVETVITAPEVPATPEAAE